MTPRLLSADAAIARWVQPGSRVLLGTASGVAVTLQNALVTQQERLERLHLFSGMQLGGYDFLGPVLAGRWRYDSWQVMPPTRAGVSEGRIGLIPARGALVPELIDRLAPDVFLTTVSPPDRSGLVSLGTSVSYAFDAVGSTATVIAEVNPHMPVLRGRTKLSVNDFTALVEADHPLPERAPPEPDPVSLSIASSVRGLLPSGATLQIGLGSIPEALVALLAEDPPPGLRLFGMGVDGMMPLVEAMDRPAAFLGGELLGTDALYRWSHDNPLVENRPIREILRVPEIAAHPRFVSLNGAIEVDLTGQVNSEWVSGRQVSAPGGAFDFVDAASFSHGGASIVCLPATARNGSVSTIVSTLSPGAPVTIPRHSTQYVVTEFGVADLRGKTVAERAEALTEIAHPRFREELNRAIDR